MGKKSDSYINSNTETLQIVPDTSLWHKLGKTKYTLPKAIGELIDNSIDSRVGNSVNVELYYQIGDNYIRVLDNAKGMTEDELKNALTIAFHQSSSDSIGEHGFGLKSSTSFLGRRLTIYTKTKA